ncbi:MAG: hypothetical protein Q7V40_10625 [Pseudolabrys sp.]|nr:hypothetical protein [Pseudolabrys sp.]
MAEMKVPMLRIAPVLLLLLCTCAAAADDPALPPANYPKIAAQAASFESFVPPGWRLERSVSGDLNGDGRPDAVLVLRDNDAKKFIETRRESMPKFDTNPRILAVAFAGDNGGYALALENHTLIARTDDPFQQDPIDPDGIQAGEIAIRNGTLRVTLGYFGGNMGRMTYTFRFQNGRFEMIGYDRVDVTRNSGVTSDISINYSTQQMVRKIGHISNDAVKTTRSKLPRKPLLTLEQVGDGMMFQPVGE